MLEVRDLVVYYENALAVNEISIDVTDGEVVGLFGSNSAGKTTLLNTIAGLTNHLRRREQIKGGMRITISGSIMMKGEEIRGLKPSERVEKGLYLCRERHPVFRDNTVEENLKLGGYLRSRAEIAEKMEDVYTLFPALKRLRNGKAGMLSGGEQEMVAIGTALMSRPDLLLMDEPLLGLSPAMQDEVVGAIEQIGRSDVTVLVSEQFARPLMPVISRAYILENGTVTVSGTSEELADNPDVRAAYLGA